VYRDTDIKVLAPASAKLVLSMAKAKCPLCLHVWICAIVFNYCINIEFNIISSFDFLFFHLTYIREFCPINGYIRCIL